MQQGATESLRLLLRLPLLLRSPLRCARCAPGSAALRSDPAAARHPFLRTCPCRLCCSMMNQGKNSAILHLEQEWLAPAGLEPNRRGGLMGQWQGMRHTGATLRPQAPPCLACRLDRDLRLSGIASRCTRPLVPQPTRSCPPPWHPCSALHTVVDALSTFGPEEAMGPGKVCVCRVSMQAC